MHVHTQHTIAVSPSQIEKAKNNGIGRQKAMKMAPEYAMSSNLDPNCLKCLPVAYLVAILAASCPVFAFFSGELTGTHPDSSLALASNPTILSSPLHSQDIPYPYKLLVQFMSISLRAAVQLALVLYGSLQEACTMGELMQSQEYRKPSRSLKVGIASALNKVSCAALFAM